MNCSRFRFLIQQSFDVQLSQQDERMVIAHLDTCDSCQRFQHQLDQVVQTSAEVPLPDECLPGNLEALAKRVMVEIPQEKPGFMSMLKSMLPFGNGAGGGKPKKEKAEKPEKENKKEKGKNKAKPEEQPHGSAFPHVKRQHDTDPPKGKKGSEMEDDLRATSTRLRNMGGRNQANLQMSNGQEIDPQAMSQSLSMKFGVNLPQNQSGGNEAPMTLAESIRRKVSEQGDDAIQGGGGFGGGVSGQFPNPGFGQTSGGFPQAQPQQPGFGGQQGAPGFGQQGQPGFGQGQAPPSVPPQQQGPNWGQGGGQPGQGAGGWGESPQTDNATDWQTGADWGAPAPSQPMQAPFGATTDSWKVPPGFGQDPSQGPGSWQMPNQPTPAQDPQPQAPQAGWGSSWPEGVEDDWSRGGQPKQGAAPAAQTNDNWGAPAPAAQKPQDQWGQPSAGQQPSPSGWAGEEWGNQPAMGEPNPADSGWGIPAQGKAADSGWDMPANAPQGDSGWGMPAVSKQDASWGNTAAPAAQAQGQPAAPKQDSWGGSDGWGSGGGEQWSSGNQQAGGAGGWGTAAPGQNQGWGDQGQAGGWSQPGQGGANQTGGWGQPGAGANPHLTASAPPAQQQAQGPNSALETWSEEGEQIQTGMWQAFTLDEPALGTPKNVSTQGGTAGGARLAPPSAPGQPQPQPQAQTDAERWDVPIQQRNAAAADSGDRWDTPINERGRPQPGAPMQQQAAPQPAADRWDVPIQQRDQKSSMDQPMPAPQRPGVPPVPVPQAPAAQAPDNSIMDRLNNILGDDLTSMASGAAPLMAGQAQQAPAQEGWSTSGQQGWNNPPAAPAPAPVPQPVAAAPQPAAAAPQPSGGLFKNLDDKTIDKVFSENLGINEGGQRPATGQQQVPVQAARPGVAPAVPQPQGGPGFSPQAPVPPLSPQAPVPPLQQPGQPGVKAPPPVIRQTGANQRPETPAPGTTGGTPRISPVAPRPTAPAPGQQAPAAEAPAAQGGGLFKIDDKAIDQIFSNNLGVKDGGGAPGAAPRTTGSVTQPVPGAPGAPVAPTAPVPPIQRPAAPALPQQPASQQWGAPSTPAPAPVPAPAPQRPAQAPQRPAGAAQGPRSGLINVDDATMDRIFADLGVDEKQEEAPKIKVREAVQAVRQAAETPQATKVEGVGRLSREDFSAQDASPGKIAAIGKFLLDQQDLTKIGRLAQEDLSDSKVRVLTLEAAEEINRLLQHIGTQAGVVGSVIVGHDGILIASNLPSEFDPESVGVWSLGIYVNTTNVSKKMGHNHLHQLVARSPHGYLVIADFGGGILVTVSDGHETDKLIPLMRSITQLVAQ